MSLRITDIEGQRFVGGLFWQTLTKPRELKKEAKSLAEELRFDFFVLRKSAVPQVGFSASEDGAEEGLLSIAAMISKSMEMEGIHGNWMGAFELPDGDFAYVAVRDDIFLVDSDLIGTRQEIKQRMSTDYSLGEWEHIFAPSDFEFSNSIERDINSLIPFKKGKIRVHKWWALQSINKAGSSIDIGGKPILIIAALCLAGIGIGGFKYYQHQLAAKESIERNKSIEEARLRLFGENLAKKKKEEELAMNNKPWADMPQPELIASACLRSVTNKITGGGGWLLRKIECDQSSFTANYDRGNSTIGNLYAVMSDANIDSSGDKAMVMHPMSISVDKSNDSLMPLSAAKLKLMDLSQEIDSNIAIKDEALPPPALPGQATNTPVPPPPPWKKTMFVVNSTISPTAVAKHIALPGLRIVKISADGTLNTPSWKIEGELYGY